MYFLLPLFIQIGILPGETIYFIFSIDLLFIKTKSFTLFHSVTSINQK